MLIIDTRLYSTDIKSLPLLFAGLQKKKKILSLLYPVTEKKG